MLSVTGSCCTAGRFVRQGQSRIATGAAFLTSALRISEEVSDIRKRDLCRSLSLILNEGGDSEWLFLYLMYTIQAKCETNLYVT